MLSYCQPEHCRCCFGLTDPIIHLPCLKMAHINYALWVTGSIAHMPPEILASTGVVFPRPWLYQESFGNASARTDGIRHPSSNRESCTDHERPQHEGDRNVSLTPSSQSTRVLKVGSPPINTCLQLSNRPGGGAGRASGSVDVYSFGVLLWELCTGERPWAELRSSQVCPGSHQRW